MYNARFCVFYDAVNKHNTMLIIPLPNVKRLETGASETSLAMTRSRAMQPSGLVVTVYTHSLRSMATLHCPLSVTVTEEPTVPSRNSCAVGSRLIPETTLSAGNKDGILE